MAVQRRGGSGCGCGSGLDIHSSGKAELVDPSHLRLTTSRQPPHSSIIVGSLERTRPAPAPVISRIR